MFERLKNLFRKESAMAETNPAPAAGTQLPADLAAQLAALTGIVGSLAESQKTIVSAVEKLTATPGTPPATGAAGAAGKPNAITLEDLTRVLDQRDQQRSAAAAKTAARQGFIESKMNDLPSAYRQLLPDTDDAGQLAAAEQRIRTQYQADFKTAGGKVPDVGGGTPGGAPPAAGVVDVSKMSPTQLVEMGLKGSRPTGSVAPGTAPAGSSGQPGATAAGGVTPGATAAK
jgi:hypothetical protein